VAAALGGSHPEHTWEVSHIGGDRFAANVLVLPEGLYYGRVIAQDAAALADRHLSGHLDLDLLRGRSGLGLAAQGAEVAVRREASETRTGAVRLLSTVEPAADLVELRFDVAGTAYDVRVRRSQDDARHRLTCRATRDNPVPAYDVEALSRASGGAPSSVPVSPSAPRG
jgi:hypothetical protein